MPKIWSVLRCFPDSLLATLSNRLLLFCLTGFLGFPPRFEVDAQESQNVPEGTLHHGLWNSEEYQGTTRDYWVYLPASHQDHASLCLMVFNDGRSYMSEQGAFRVPEVMDRLIHQKAMPATIAIFINPGEIPSSEPGKAPRKNRSFEYDALGDRYARFLMEEFLPPIEAQYPISKKPEHRAICGISSGGIGAFTVAWEHPEAFGKVLCHIGSFVHIRGGHAYPYLIRKTEKKPLKIFLQEGVHDLDNVHGHWPLANKEMAAALEFKGYEYQFVMTQGGHSGQPGGRMLADSLRWLWKDTQL